MRPTRLLAFLLFLLPVSAVADCDFYLKDGDRVVFYGDSITEQRLYTTFTETYVVTRFPKMNVAFTHSGWGGDRVTGGGGGPVDVRLKRDVIAYKPTVMTIMLGMNDASYRAFDEKIFNTYARGYEHIVEKVKSELPGIRLTLIQPSPFDDVTRPPAFEGGYNAVLVRYGEFVKELAKKENVDVADLNTSVVEATKKAYEKDPEKAVKLNPDRVHPGQGGQLLMAAALLDAWHAPSTVSKVSLALVNATGDSKNSDIKVNGVKSNVSEASFKDATLSWTEHDEALPFPINLKDGIVRLAVESSDILAKLDQQILLVEGLEKDHYTLKIDGNEIGTFSKEELAKGINLSAHDTPMLRQAEEVHRLTLKHNEIHATRWRSVQFPLEDQDQELGKKAMDALDDLEAGIVARQRETAQPKPRKYELAPKS